CQVAEALRAIHEEGIAEVFHRHEEMATRVRQGVKEVGLALQCPAFARFSPTLTAVDAPEHLSPRAIIDGVLERGILLASALGPFDGRASRIGHMGDIRLADVEATLAALTDVIQHAPTP